MKAAPGPGRRIDRGGRRVDFVVLTAAIVTISMGIVLLAVVFFGCTPLPPPDSPEPPPPPPVGAHCPDACEQLQALGCKRGSNEVCSEFDAEGECTATMGCVEACREAPHAYPRGVIEECP